MPSWKFQGDGVHLSPVGYDLLLLDLQQGLFRASYSSFGSWGLSAMLNPSPCDRSLWVICRAKRWGPSETAWQNWWIRIAYVLLFQLRGSLANPPLDYLGPRKATQWFWTPFLPSSCCSYPAGINKQKLPMVGCHTLRQMACPSNFGESRRLWLFPALAPTHWS